MKTRKTRAEWLKLIPLKTRLQIIEAAKKDGNRMYRIKNNNSDFTYNLYDAFASLFTFSTTKQGHDYWVSKLNKLIKTCQ